MKLFEEIRELLESGVQTPKQFAELPEPIEVVSMVSVEDQIRMEAEFERTCELLQAEECQALSVMNDIVAGGPSMQKSLKK